jgi:hypothetical protein
MQGIQAMPENVEQIRECLRKMSDLNIRGPRSYLPV